MKSFRPRVPHFVLLHVLLSGFLPTTAPSDPMGPEVLADAPGAEEIAFLEELAGWVGTGNEPDRPLRRAVRHSLSFDLFRSFHDGSLGNERLRQLPYGDAIRRVADRHRVDPLLIAAVVEAESGFDPQAVSRRGAVGLMQIMPATAAIRDVSPEELTEPHLNLDLGARYLGQLLRRHGGDLALALAAYNAGPANVQRFGGVPPFRETRRYVEKVLHLYVGHHRTVWRESELAKLLSPYPGLTPRHAGPRHAGPRHAGPQTKRFRPSETEVSSV